MKKFSGLVLAAVVLATNVPVVLGAPAFQDSVDSKYADAIESLHAKGIVNGDGTGFAPERLLTREEAAAMVRTTFKLVGVPYRESSNEELEKTFVSTDTSIAQLESAIMPAAEDVKEGWSKVSVETVVEARLMNVEDGQFNPRGTMTRAEFAEVVATAIYGAESDVDYIATGLADGLLPADLALDGTEITREEAAYILNTVVSNDDFKIIPMMFTSDIHGHLVPYPAAKSDMQLGALSRIATLVDELREIDEDMLLLDAGDSPYNTNLANLFEGRSTVDAMNAMGYDATVLGNHDFDFVFENLLSLAERAEYHMLSANTYMIDGTYPEQLSPYYIEEIDGVKVSIVGLTDDASKMYTHFENTENVLLKDEFETAEAVIAEAEAASDVVIVLAHLHRDNLNVPAQIDGIDLEVGGGNDIFGRPEYVNDTVIINPGAHSAVVTQVNVNVLDKEMVGYTANQLIVTDAIEEQEEVKAVIDDYVQKMGEMMGEVVGQATDDFVWSAPLVRSQENALANLAADTQRAYFDADIALQNGGGVRAGIAAGDVTLNDVYTSFPFDNRMVLIETTGQTIWNALEHGVALYPATAGQFLQVSGISYEFDGSAPTGERMIAATMPDGTALDLTKTYRVVINDFMAGGGDGYSMFNVLNEATGLTTESKLILNTNDYIRDVFNNHLKEAGEMTPVLEGRIKIQNPQETDSKIG